MTTDTSVARASAVPSRARSLLAGPLSDWWLPLGVFALARLVSAWILTVAAQVQPDLTRDPHWHVEGTRPASPSYWEVLSNWDGQWFKTIAMHGYADIDTAGPATQNALGFSPLYPLTVRGVMSATGMTFEVAASLVSLTCAGVAILLLFRWLVATRGLGPALAAVAVLSFFPSAPILQAAYSDGMAMLLLVVTLRSVAAGRPAAALVSALALAYTRPILMPVAMFVLYTQWRRSLDQPGERPVTVRATLLAAALGTLSFAWAVTAGLITGDIRAYWKTFGAWRSDGTPVGGWFTGLWNEGLPHVAIAMVAIMAALVYLRWRRRRERVPADLLGGWAGIYLFFVLLTAPPNAGIVRHLLLTLVPLGMAGPMAVALPARRRAVLLGVVVLVEIALQWLWVRYVFVVADPTRAPIP